MKRDSREGAAHEKEDEDAGVASTGAVEKWSTEPLCGPTKYLPTSRQIIT